MGIAVPICLKLLRQAVCAGFFAGLRENREYRIAARIAIMAITTSSSISVKPNSILDFGFWTLD